MLTVLAVVAILYQLLAAFAALAFKRAQRAAFRRPPTPPSGVSILKPVYGIEPSMRAAIASHTNLQGEYEFLCGIRPGDPASRILAEFPKARTIECRTLAPNGKVGVLTDLAAAARSETLVINDADIRVEPDYLARVTAPLADPDIGLVTCLYRAEGATFPARLEALGIATEFAPSTLVARVIGVDRFAMGSTMAVRRADLERIGGFPAIASYLADDFQLGSRIHALGKRCLLSEVVVTTQMGGGWRDVWVHQVRWARTIRVSNFWGYLGLPASFATLWAVVLAAFGQIYLAAMVLAARMLMATIAGWTVLGSRDVLRLWPLIPLRDLAGAAVWVTGLSGRTVLWRGERLRIDAEGRIVSLDSRA